MASKTSPSTCGGGGGGGGPTPTPAPPPIIGVDLLISAQTGQTYNNAFAWCTNPNFSDRTGEGPGTFFGIFRSVRTPGFYPGGDPTTPYIFVGFHSGNFLGKLPRWNGYGADTFVQNPDGTYSESDFQLAHAVDAGTSYFSTSIEPASPTYDDIQIDGVTQATGTWQGSSTATFMAGGLWETATSATTAFFNFASGASCSGLQTYSASAGWQNWNPSDVSTEWAKPSGQVSSSVTFTYTQNANYMFVYP